MATQTENLGLSKPAYSEPTDIGVINSNMDILDGAIGGSDMGTEAETITGAIAEHSEAIGGIATDVEGIGQDIGSVKSDIGIVEDGDVATHSIESGQYVIWKNELYKATAAIPIGTALSSTNLEAEDNGIGGAVSTLTEQMANLIVYENLLGQSTDANGLIITDLAWSNKYYGGIANKGTGYYYVELRPSGSSKVVIHVKNESGSLASTSGLSITLFKINI